MPPNPLLHRLVQPVLLLLVALGAGCVEFESQTILVRYDKAADTIHVRLIYRGLYAGADESDPEKDVAEALAQLKTVVDRGTRFYIFDNWPFEADVGAPEEGEEDKPGNALLRPFTKVKNGKFFLDVDGKLCAWQDIEFSKATALLEQTNRLLSLAVMTGQVDGLKEVDETTRRLLQQWMAKGEPWVVVDATGAEVRLPASDADAARLKTRLLKEAVEMVEDDARKRDEANAKGKEVTPFERTHTGAHLRTVAENRVSVIHEQGRVTLRLPADARGVVRFDWHNRGTYRPNLLEPPKEGELPPVLPAPLEKQLGFDALVEAFASPPAEKEDKAE